MLEHAPKWLCISTPFTPLLSVCHAHKSKVFGRAQSGGIVSPHKLKSYIGVVVWRHHKKKQMENETTRSSVYAPCGWFVVAPLWFLFVCRHHTAEHPHQNLWGIYYEMQQTRTSHILTHNAATTTVW